MSIKLALLKSGETVISDAKELISDDKMCGYLFTNPHKVEARTPMLLVEETESKSSGELRFLSLLGLYCLRMIRFLFHLTGLLLL